MAELTSVPKMELKVTLTLSEAEIRALDNMCSWKIDDIILGIFQSTGKEVERNHKETLVKFFTDIKSKTGIILHNFDEAKKHFFVQEK